MNTERITDNVSSSVKAFSNMAKITKVDDKRVYYELSSHLDHNFIGFRVKLNHYNANNIVRVLKRDVSEQGPSNCCLFILELHF